MSFHDKDSRALFEGRYCKRLPKDIQRVAQHKLAQINAATLLETLKVPPGNRLEVIEK